MEHKEWPLYFAENLILGSEKSSVGVATLWTPKEAVANRLNPETFKVVGQLYSNDGINPLLRNVLANPTIRTIIVCGQDKIGSADSLVNLINNGINEKGEVIGKEESKVEKEIPRDAVELFRKNVQIVDVRGTWKPKELQPIIDKYKQDPIPWAESQVFPEPEISTDWYPSEGSSYTYRGKTVADVWPKVLHGILRFGETKKSNHTNTTQKELLNIVTVVTDEDPDNIIWADYFDFTREHLQGYLPQVMTPDPIPSISYTYGMRLRNHNGVNQVHTIIEKLKKTAWDRQAVAVTWNVEQDNESPHPPCLDIVQALIKYDKVYLTVYFRSNDMFRAWPENAFALRAMQKEIADAIGFPMGSLTVVSNSAHIYEENINKAKDIVEMWYPKLPCEQDPRGNYVIKVIAGKEIQVTHMSPSGRKIDVITGTTAMGIFNELARNEAVSVYIHAMDLGAELQKAEIALTLGIEYTQDRPLPYDQLCK
ncbi:MAG: hypothetical protein HYV32_04395 [Candidatus Kerfeldbacteria bacterium]|nr:hypothetical protein [Candidatus Kerfeldbacteria bacterium]